MIAVLLAAPGVAARRLQVTTRIGADPDVAPRRWNRQRADAAQCAPVPHQAPALVPVREAAPPPLPRQARSRVADVAQTGVARRLGGVEGCCGWAGHQDLASRPLASARARPSCPSRRCSAGRHGTAIPSSALNMSIRLAALTAAIVSAAHVPTIGGVSSIDTLLRTHFRFTAAQVAEVQRGRAVSVSLPGIDRPRDGRGRRRAHRRAGRAAARSAARHPEVRKRRRLSEDRPHQRPAERRRLCRVDAAARRHRGPADVPPGPLRRQARRTRVRAAGEDRSAGQPTPTRDSSSSAAHGTRRGRGVPETRERGAGGDARREPARGRWPSSSSRCWPATPVARRGDAGPDRLSRPLPECAQRPAGPRGVLLLVVRGVRPQEGAADQPRRVVPDCPAPAPRAGRWRTGRFTPATTSRTRWKCGCRSTTPAAPAGRTT